jgi:hypothetical protein
VPSLRESPKQTEQAPLSRTIGGFNGIRRARARSNYLIASGYRLSAARLAGRNGTRSSLRSGAARAACWGAKPTAESR